LIILNAFDEDKSIVNKISTDLRTFRLYFESSSAYNTNTLNTLNNK